MDLSCFSVEEDGGVAHVRMNRPDALNSMTRAFWVELPEIIGSLSDGGTTRAVVLSSTGRHFTAGMDLGVFATSGPDGTGSPATDHGRRNAAMRTTVTRVQEVFSTFETARMPVLAAIQGGCVGGGVDMVAAADMRYCSADAFFCIQEINLAMTADLGTLQRLPRVMPDGLARELAYTGRRLGAEEALACGLVNAVFPGHDELVDGVLEIAATIAAKSPLAVWGTKEMLHFSRDHTIADSLAYLANWQSGMFQPDDMTEVMAAKAEGRDPVFADLPPVPDHPLG